VPKPVFQGTTIPLVVNRLVEQNIAFFQGRGREHMERWLYRSGRYFPLMKRILAEEGLPEEIVYLSLVESGLNPTARSWAKAVGIWQFVKGTGRLYGLSGNYWYDERRDFEKATRAAARHLKDLNEEFGDWYLALAAYNSGAGRVYRGIRRSRSTDFWAMRRHLPRETRNYVPQFIAVAIICTNPRDYGFSDIAPDEALAFDVVTVDDCVDLDVLAQCAGTDAPTLRELNPELIQWCTPPATTGYMLRVPVGAAGNFKERYAAIPDDQKRDWVVHTIRRGETLGSIARKYRISVGIIKETNKQAASARLRVGRTLVIPVSRMSAAYAAASPERVDRVSAPRKRTVDRSKVARTLARAERTAPESMAGKARLTYKVKKGDTIGHIAEWYGCRAAEIRNWNDRPYGRPILAGSTLVIWVNKRDQSLYAKIDGMTFEEKEATVRKAPVAQTDDSAPEGATRYIVKEGDTLDKIAQANNASIRQLQRWNKLRGSRITAGQVLFVYADAQQAQAVIGSHKGQATVSEDGSIVYVVRKGDTLYDIAKAHNVAADQLKAWNELSRSKIYAGQELIIHKGGADLAGSGPKQ
jgi:membrane-bound lytic murein transglycosylase D